MPAGKAVGKPLEYQVQCRNILQYVMAERKLFGFHTNRTPKPIVVAPDIGWVATAIGAAEADRTAATPRTAAHHAVIFCACRLVLRVALLRLRATIKIFVTPVAAPLPDVSRHVVQSIPAMSYNPYPFFG